MAHSQSTNKPNTRSQNLYKIQKNNQNKIKKKYKIIKYKNDSNSENESEFENDSNDLIYCNICSDILMNHIYGNVCKKHITFKVREKIQKLDQSQSKLSVHSMTTRSFRQKVKSTTCTFRQKLRKLDTIHENEKVEKVDKQINTDKQLKDYKIFVFDLDDTLYLHNVDKNYVEIYHKKVKNFLVYLKDNDKRLYIATHNFGPSSLLNRMDIPPLLFNGIIKETKNVNPYINHINEYTSKKDMILEILDKNPEFTTDDVVFFDDHEYNIKEVESINVKSIRVDARKGIDFNEI